MRLGLMLLITALTISSEMAAQDQFKHIVKLVKPNPSPSLSYEDVSIKIQFVSFSQLSFLLSNKTDGPVEVLWNRVSLVDTNSEAHRVIHAGIRFIERDRELPSTFIPPGALITETIIPADHISYDRESSEGWKQQPFIQAPLNRYEGLSFSLYLPLRIKGVVKDYMFVFRIEKELLTAQELKAIEQKKLDSIIDPSTLVQVKITKKEYGDSWPFTIPEATLACSGLKGIGRVLLITQHKTYAINGVIAGKTYNGKPVFDDLTEIRDIFKDIKPILQRGLEMCP